MPPGRQRIRILVCDDHELVRRGLCSVLGGIPGYEVVGEAGDADAAVSAAERLRPDVVVMDVRLPTRSGIEACREIRSAHPETRVVMLTSHADEEALFSSIMAGASGYLLKRLRGDDIIESLRQVAGGRSLLDPAVAERVLSRLHDGARGSSADLGELTAQERRILDLMAEGHTNRQIAADVGLAEKTVKNYVSNILGKLGLARRAEAAAPVARREGGLWETWREPVLEQAPP